MINWLLEPEIFQQYCDPLIDALNKSGTSYAIHSFGKLYEDYVYEDWGNDTVFYGSMQFAKFLKDQTNWKGIYCNLRKLDCLYYYPKFGNRLYNACYTMLPFGDLLRCKETLFYEYSSKGEVFLRPSSGYKTFTGKVFKYEDWEKELKLLSLRIDIDTLVLVSTPGIVKTEWRFVIKGKDVITGSRYKVDGKVDPSKEIPAEVLEYAKTAVEEVNYNPDPVWTLDICKDNGGNLSVLEVGSFSCAGLYHCDMETIVRSVNETISS